MSFSVRGLESCDQSVVSLMLAAFRKLCQSRLGMSGNGL